MAALIMDRRQFLKTGAAAAITGTMAGTATAAANNNSQDISRYAPLSAEPEFILGARWQTHQQPKPTLRIYQVLWLL